MNGRRNAFLPLLVSVFLVTGVIGTAAGGESRGKGDRRSQELEEDSGTASLAASGSVASEGRLQMYEATVDSQTLQELVDAGYDVTVVDMSARGAEVALVLSKGERDALAAKGVDLTVARDNAGLSATQRAAVQAENGFNVFRSFDEPGGIRDEMYQIAEENRDLVKLEVLGRSHQEREIIALKVTRRARKAADGKRPAVLYVSTYHAREWISTEVNRRLLHWYIDQYRAGDPQIRRLLSRTELWFVLVHNPDGYEYTFDVERLWRKNLRDNDGDGKITNSDGVDLNRNHSEHWKYDEEGSSSQISSETYRGPAPNSEPETEAIVELFDRVDFRFAISWHSFGELLLYPQGWQVLTPTADDPIYVALTGTDDNPAVPDFNPGVSADLYTTNGEFTDWAHGERGTLAWTPELSEGCEDCGFVFPDDEALVQAEFERNRQFAVNVARSARDPDDPVSHAGIDTRPLYLDVSEIDPWKTNWPLSDLRVDLSYGGRSSQVVQVLAKRDLRPVKLFYRKNGGNRQSVRTREVPDGEVYGGNNAYNDYYHYLQGRIRRLRVGDTVRYWFRAGGKRTERVTFEVVEDADADVLILAAEDRTGASNVPAYTSTDPATPNFLSYYTDALTANGVSFDVYDVDAEGRVAPDDLGALSHYDSVIWYRGNDFVVREPEWTPGNVSRLAVEETLEIREYLNHEGNLLYTGQWAGATENGVAGGQFYDPVANERCILFEPPEPDADPEPVPGPVFDRCLLWSDKNDFIQYYLGAYIYNSDAGTDPETGEPFPVVGTADPYTGMSWSFNGEDSAQNQVHTAGLLTTSSILPKDEFPQFTSDARAEWDRGVAANPFQPFDGSWYLYSQQADISYKQLTRSFTMPAGGGDMTFRMSYDTEPAWDFVFVEIHNVTEDTWATAPDLNGHTEGGTPESTGESCPAGWHELHPWLEQYQGADCNGAGWNAASGRSEGWEEWQIDLDAFADPGEEIDIYISYASDWAVQGLGVFFDYVQLPGEAVESFETGMGEWSVTGPPPGSAPNPNNFIRTQDVGFEEGAIVSETPTTADFVTLFFGFGFEGITGASTREAVMDASLDFLGV